MLAKINRFELFKNIFPDYNSFAEWYRSTPLSDSEDDVPSLKTFTLIAYEFNSSHVNSSVESFKQRFANDLYTYYREFEATTASVVELMRLTDEEIAKSDEVITNIANIPETGYTTDSETVNFVSTQQKMINKKGKLQVKKEQLSNKRTFTTKTFINRFRHLFQKFISPNYNYVIGEPEEAD